MANDVTLQLTLGLVGISNYIEERAKGRSHLLKPGQDRCSVRTKWNDAMVFAWTLFRAGLRGRQAQPI